MESHYCVHLCNCTSQSAEDWDYKGKIEKHGSQLDYSTGFGGKYGVQVDRQDKSAVGWDHVEKVEKHESQKGKIIFTTSLIFCIHTLKIQI